MYKCSACDSLFYSQVDCRSHVRDRHPDSNPDPCTLVYYRCPLCEQLFGHQADVRNHALRDHGRQRVKGVEVPA